MKSVEGGSFTTNLIVAVGVWLLVAVIISSSLIGLWSLRPTMGGLATALFFIVSGISLYVIVAITRGTLVSLRRLRRRDRASGARPRSRRQAKRLVQNARQEGEEDMRAAWIQWHLGSLPAQKEERNPALIDERLRVVPKRTWNVTQLQIHGQAVWSLRDNARRNLRLAEVDARLDQVAARLFDLTDKKFDTRLGHRNGLYVNHPERSVRSAYYEGGSKGVEVIMETVTAVRAEFFEEATTSAASKTMIQQRNAALQALREIRQPPEGRDAHAAWEAEAKKISKRRSQQD